MALILKPPSVQTSLAERLGALAHWQRIWSVAAGLLQTLALLFIATSISLGLDLVFELPPATRVLLLVSIISMTVAMIFTKVFASLKRCGSPLRFAIQAESCYPDLNDALASAVAFQESSSSPNSFRHAAVQQAEELTETLPWNRLLPLAQMWRWFWLAVLSATLLAILVMSHATLISTAIARLCDPWGGHSWPTRTRIIVESYHERLALGDNWTLAFTVHGDIPESARIELRSAGNRISETVNLATDLQEVHGRASFDPSRVSADFDFRILAGDDSTNWQSVVVAPPPRLVPLDGRPSPQMHLDYPAYMGWSPLDLPAGTVTVEAVCGTRITLSAATDRPISKATLVHQGDASSVAILQSITPLVIPNSVFSTAATVQLSQNFTQPISVTVSGPDRTRLQATLIPPLAGTYALRFTDDTGLTGQRLLELRNFADPTPAVTLIRPDAVHDVVELLVDSTLLLEAQADDRTFAVRSLSYEWRFAGEPWQTSTDRDLQQVRRDMPALVEGMIPFASWHPTTLSSRRETAITNLHHSDGRPPQEGDELFVRAAGRDWDDVTLDKQAGLSREARICLHSTASLEALLQRGLIALRVPLKKARDTQDAAGKAANRVEAQAAQDAVRKTIADAQNGLRAQVAQLNAIARRNELGASATTARLAALDQSLARIDEKLLPATEAALSAAKDKLDWRERVAKSQAATARELAAAASELDRWAGVAELQSDIHHLAEDLRKNGEAARRLRDQLPAGVTNDRLTTGERAALERTASEQANAADSLKGLIGKASAMRDTKTVDPTQRPDVDKLEKLLRQAGGDTAVEQLRQSAAATRDNRLNDAETLRAEVADRVQAMEAALAGREDGAEELKRRKTSTAKAVEALQSEQEELAKKIKAAAGMDRAKLAFEQEALRRKAEALAEQLSAEKEAEAAETLKRAALNMEKTAEQLTDSADAHDDAAQAARDLANAQQQLQAEATKPDLQREQKSDDLKSLKAFRDRQQAVLDELQRLSVAAAQAGRWGRPQIASLVTLAEREASLGKELRGWSETAFADAVVFAKLAWNAVERIEQTAARLRDRKDDALTATSYRKAAEDAADEAVRKPLLESLRRIDQIISALAEPKQKPAAAKAKEATPPMPGSEPMKSKASPLAQLKALREWQFEIQNRTTEFAKANPDTAKLNDDDRAELAELQLSQTEIAKLFELLRESLMTSEAP